MDRLLANGTKLVGQAMPLPMDAAGLRDMMLSQAGLPPEVAVNMDFASPSAAAFVALDGKGKSGAVMAVPARGPAEAQKIIDALGKKITTRGPATLVEGNTGGRGWLYRSGNVVVLSDEADALARGTMLTLEARRAGADDVTAVMYPEAIARANGTDVKTAIDKFLKEMQQKQAVSTPGVGGGDAAANENSLQAVGEALALAGDASSIEASLVADPAKGLIIHARFNARPGTKLESVAKEVKPFSVDPAVATTSTNGRFIVGGNSLGPFWRGVLATYRDRLAADKQKGAAVALTYYDAVLAAMAGQQSTSMSLYKEAPYLSGAFAFPLKDAASAGQVAKSLAALDSAAASALLRAQLGDTSSVEWTVKKETVGKLKTQHFRVKMKKKRRRCRRDQRSVEAPHGTDAGRLLGGRRHANADDAGQGREDTADRHRLRQGAARAQQGGRRGAGGGCRARSVLLPRPDAGAGRGRIAHRRTAAGGAGEGRRQPDSDDLHGGRRRRRQAVDDGPDGAGGGVHGHRVVDRGGNGLELASGSPGAAASPPAPARPGAGSPSRRIAFLERARVRYARHRRLRLRSRRRHARVCAPPRVNRRRFTRSVAPFFLILILILILNRQSSSGGGSQSRTGAHQDPGNRCSGAREPSAVHA